MKPIEEKNVRYWQEKLQCDTKTAEGNAAKEFLECFLNMKKEDIEAVDIVKSKHTKAKKKLYTPPPLYVKIFSPTIK